MNSIHDFSPVDQPPTSGTSNYNYETLKLVAKKLKTSVTNLLALAPKNDPFYVGTPATVERGQWFANTYFRANYSLIRAPHLRRVHYWIVSQDPPLAMPDGKPYTNTQGCWEFLIEASKAARYLGLIPLSGIIDNKNPSPHIHANYWDDTPDYEVQLPDLATPDVYVYGLHDANVQPYHLEIWCEKSTMNDVLIPVAQKYNANLVTFEGEVSITSVCVNLMTRIRQSDFKPTRIFYISDFDPAGNSMPVAMSRKLEFAIRQHDDPAYRYDVKVKPLALTAGQVEQYRLPRIPIKETEKRAGRFEEAFGAGAVELDALEALYPGTLASIVDEALEPYYSYEAHNEVMSAAADLRNDVATQIAKITAKYQPQIDALKKMQDELRAIQIDAEQYRVERFEPHVEEEDDFLFDSSRGYVEQIRAYKAHKNGVEA